MRKIIIDTKKIKDKTSFHRVFKESLGFLDFYGNNMDAWIDCLSDLHEDYGLCRVKLVEGEMLHIHITDTTDFNKRQPELMKELIECAAFVNFRSVSAKEQPKLSLVFLDSS